MDNRFHKNAAVTKSAWKSSHGPIQVVDFSKTDSFKDIYGALGCIAVLTSNGMIGTLTHLKSSVSKLHIFIRNFDLVLGEHKDTSKVVLSGGSGRQESRALYHALQHILQQHGYHVVAGILIMRH